MRFASPPAALPDTCPSCGTRLDPLSTREALGYPLASEPLSEHDFLVALAAALPRGLPFDGSA